MATVRELREELISRIGRKELDDLIAREKERGVLVSFFVVVKVGDTVEFESYGNVPASSSVEVMDNCRRSKKIEGE